jgi:AraC family transcriptional regulator
VGGDILAVAVEAGYGSYEAFTRAFREELAAPRMVGGQARWMVGLSTGERAEIPGQVGRESYGVCHSEGYLTRGEVGDVSRVSGEWERVRLAAALYAVFRNIGHVSTVRRTWFTIWNGAGLRPTREPEVELYGAVFDGSTGFGGFEIWMPVAEGQRARDMRGGASRAVFAGPRGGGRGEGVTRRR